MKYNVEPTAREKLQRQAKGDLTNTATTAPAAVSMSYNNGPLLASVEVYAVFWGPNVNSDTVSNTPAFFSAITNSPMMSMLNEYTAGGFTIGNGTFKAAYTDADAPMPAAGAPLDDETVQAEITRLIDTGKLPANDGKNIYVMFFPPNLTIQHGSEQSCSVFCGYHNSFQRNGTDAAHDVYYAIIPDHTSNGCEQVCGAHAPLDNLYRTTSHELSEAISDPEPGNGWYDNNYGEIGDVCAFWDGNTNNYAVQTEWSQTVKGCRDHAPATNSGAALTVTGGTVGAPGGQISYTVSSTGKSGSLTLSSPDLDLSAMGFNGAFSPASIKVNGGTSTLKLTIPSTMRSYSGTFTIAGVDGDGTYYYSTVPFNVKGAAPTITGTNPTSLTTTGGPIELDGTNFGVGATAFVCATSRCTASSRVPIAGSYKGGSGGKTFLGTMPGHKAGTVTIGLLNPNDTTVVKTTFTFTAGAAPMITKVDPPSGPTAGGTVVFLTGSNFGSNAKVSVAGTPLTAFPPYNLGTFGVFGSDTIAIITPAGTMGMQDIVVTNADGQTGKTSFNYGPNAPPEIDHLSVTSGPTAGGQYLTIFGQNFDGMATVAIDNVAATMQSKAGDGSFAGIVTPAHAAGQVNLVITNSDGQTSTTTYTYGDGTGTDDGGAGTADGGAGTDDGGGGGNGGSGGGVGGNGGAGGNQGMPGPNNAIGASRGCSVGGNGGGTMGALLILLALAGLGLRRRRA